LSSQWTLYNYNFWMSQETIDEVIARLYLNMIIAANMTDRW
jgi:hypothetical protein